MMKKASCWKQKIFLFADLLGLDYKIDIQIVGNRWINYTYLF
jgi:hypothetical protein